MSLFESTPTPGNPYRRPRPRQPDIIAAGKFRLANGKGTYIDTEWIQMALCEKYIWVSEALSIPLSSIIEVGLSRRGGWIRYWDALNRSEMEFNFTSVGFLGYKREKVQEFLNTVLANVPSETPERGLDSSAVAGDSDPAADVDKLGALRCEVCGSDEANVITLYVFRFVGIILLAYKYSLTPLRHVVCAEDARRSAIRCSLRTAVAGYLGFPGFLAAPWYVCKNLLALRSVHAGDTRTAMICMLACIFLPLAIIAVPIVLMLEYLD